MKTLTAVTSSIIVSLSLAACSPESTVTNSASKKTPTAVTTPNSASPIKVDRSNYQEAEVARNFTKWAENGANNKLMHMTAITPSGPMPTVRMNRDTLYSSAILDTSTGKASITLPEGVNETNFVLTKPGEGWFAYFRFYGPLDAYFDKTWVPNDFQKASN
jgi:hypothetical protein